ncbi:MAG: hypothetical protein AAFQ82_08935, partial [Myxococcota bacterium]
MSQGKVDRGGSSSGNLPAGTEPGHGVELAGADRANGREGPTGHFGARALEATDAGSVLNSARR